MLKKPDVLEKNKFHIRVQHPQIYQNQLVLSFSFFFVLHSEIGKWSIGVNCRHPVAMHKAPFKTRGFQRGHRTFKGRPIAGSSFLVFTSLLGQQ